jgi:hypothetical protein
MITNDELTELERLLNEPDPKCTHNGGGNWAWICSSCRTARDAREAHRIRAMTTAIPGLIAALRELRHEDNGLWRTTCVDCGRLLNPGEVRTLDRCVACHDKREAQSIT